MTKEHPTPEDAPQTPGIYEQLVVTHNYNAPMELVFRAWTDVEMLKQWWGPRGSRVVSAAMDLSPGGAFHYALEDASGQTSWAKFTFLDILPTGHLIFISSFADEAGNTVRAPFSETWPMEILTNVGFDERGEGTHLVLSAWPHQATDDEIETFRGAHNSMMEGLTSTLNHLAVFLARVGHEVQPDE